MIKRILVGLGGTPYTPAAIQHGVELATRFDAFVTGITILDYKRLLHGDAVPPGGASWAKALREWRLTTAEERVTASIAAFEQACTEGGVRHAVVTESGAPIDRLIAHWRYHDLTVFGMRGLFEYGVFEEPVGAVLKLITAGVRPIFSVALDFRPVERVLIAYSGSLVSAKAMKRFVQLNLWPGAAVRIVHFGDDPKASKTLLDEAAAYCRAHGVEAERDARSGAGRSQLLPYAHAENFDLIVMGDSIQTFWTRKMFGTTAEHVFRNADRPLLISH